MLKYVKNTKGMTLVEVIASIAILSIIVIPISNMFLTTVKINRHSQDLLIANKYAQKIIEEQRLSGNGSGNVSFSFPDGGHVNVNYVSVDDPSPMPHLLEEQNMPLFHAFMVLEKNSNYGQVELYQLDASNNYQLAAIFNNVANLKVDVFSDPDSIITVTDGTFVWDIPYSKNAGEPVLIGIECYHNLNIAVNIYNHIEDYTQIYTISRIDSATGNFATSNVEVINRYGKVGIIKKENDQAEYIDKYLYKRNSKESLLKKIDVTSQKNNQSTNLTTYKLKD
ncbi:prepilin-type N-terminal cleavage/methylation domain-containing protein [Thermotalea metallivorans]|uniref:Prepilin-type N-terminal cleavage/methylation domain-containing protein n=1 Tax=Thermotalea metallivorans TaxID=520762 RepID=A0A140L8A7_9FIRM|nr:prepilin-type N-terminal cleavage/methylation domain-containing protein [Thermotalea metallivorans]KXG76782.1 hypothetical protein AN619_07740 [Thermotalea metallivorans]